MALDIRETVGLKHGPVEPAAVHLCVDMQRLFQDDTPWKTPWMGPVAPIVSAIANAHAGSTVFTRFIPAAEPEAGQGAWRRYWDRWSMITLSQLDLQLLDLIPELATLAPPAIIFDKTTYSPWLDGSLHALLQHGECGTLIVTGGETDVCVLATVLGAVDLGYRVIVVADALCSSADETHDAVMTIYGSRFGEQIEVVKARDILEGWHAGSDLGSDRR